MEASRDMVDPAVKLMEKKEGKYLTFTLADEEYGIGILKIREIIGMMPITTIPQTPQFVKGVINLRGKVIPIIDLRQKFGMESIDYTDRTCIIVVEIDGTVGNVQIGIVVDSVSEVLNIKKEDIEFKIFYAFPWMKIMVCILAGKVSSFTAFSLLCIEYGCLHLYPPKHCNNC
jgi:purine-binding chemotaxis protein CheW